VGLKLIGEVALDGSGFERGLSSMTEAAGSFKAFIAGAFGTLAIEAAMRKTAETAKDLVNESLRLGVSIELLQVLKQAAKDGGKELGDMANMFEKIDVARDKALSGSKEGMALLARFGQLGISREDLLHQSASALTMGPIHQKALSISPENLDPILRAFGKGLVELIPTLQTNFAELEKRMQGLGLIMDTTTAVKLTSFANGLDLVSNFIAAQFGPTLVHALEKIEEGVSSFLGWMDDRFRGKPPGEADAHKDSWTSRAWGFSGKVGSAMIGGATGLFGFWDSIIGDTEKADERLIQAQGWFKQAGLEGGWLNEAADAMVANANKGAPSLKKAFDALVEQRKKELAELIERLKHPIIPDLSVTPADGKEKEKNLRAFHESGDALVRVGNFLGSSRSVMQDIGEKQVQLLQQIANNTNPALRSPSGGMSDLDFSTT
jgi:hypothetical protein